MFNRNKANWYGVKCNCIECTKRTVGCHATCEDYIKFHNDLVACKKKEKLDNAYGVRDNTSWSYTRKERKH